METSFYLPTHAVLSLLNMAPAAHTVHKVGAVPSHVLQLVPVHAKKEMCRNYITKCMYLVK